MKIPLFLILGSLFLPGCATAPKSSAPVFSPPSVTKAWTSVSQAQSQARDIEALAPADLQPRISEIRTTLSTAQTDLAAYASQVASQTDQLNTANVHKNAAIEEAEKWHFKQEKGLREIWFWRLIILTEIGCVVGWLALRGGLKAFLP